MMIYLYCQLEFVVWYHLCDEYLVVFIVVKLWIKSITFGF